MLCLNILRPECNNIRIFTLYSSFFYCLQYRENRILDPLEVNSLNNPTYNVVILLIIRIILPYAIILIQLYSVKKSFSKVAFFVPTIFSRSPKADFRILSTEPSSFSNISFVFVPMPFMLSSSDLVISADLFVR